MNMTKTQLGHFLTSVTKNVHCANPICRVLSDTVTNCDTQAISDHYRLTPNNLNANSDNLQHAVKYHSRAISGTHLEMWWFWYCGQQNI